MVVSPSCQLRASTSRSRHNRVTTQINASVFCLTYVACQVRTSNCTSVLTSFRFVFSQFDPKFASEGKHFVPFDFNKPQDVPSELVGTFDFVVVDPPFITREVWELYTQTVKLLLRSKDSKVLLTTIGELNFCFLAALVGDCCTHLVVSDGYRRRECGDDTRVIRLSLADIQAVHSTLGLPVCTLHQL